VVFQGYTTTAADGGKATVDGGTSGASYVLLSVTGGVCDQFVDLVFQNNGATGSANGVSVITGGNAHHFRRCVFSNVRGNGVQDNQTCVFVECEAFGCNQSNTSNFGGFFPNSSGFYLRCVAHDNAGSNTNGFTQVSAGAACVRCIADTNGLYGWSSAGVSNSHWRLANCDFYNNGGDGVRLGSAGVVNNVYLESCNFLKNGGYALNGVGSVIGGAMLNCGFGSGTQANTSGQTNNVAAVQQAGSVTYPANVTPWVDPANGDFRINLTEAKGAGCGAFTQTAPSYAGTVSYPDIGAAQHLEVTGGGGSGGGVLISSVGSQLIKVGW
jgi:hypothetical protein